MQPLSIILFGGNEEQRTAITDMAPASYHIQCYPLHQNGIEGGNDCEKLIYLVIQNQSEDKGLHQLRRLKRQYPNVPVVMLENAPSKDDIVAAFRMGADDFLSFPLQKDEFQTIIQNKAVRPRRQRKSALKSWEVLREKIGRFFSHKRAGSTKVEMRKTVKNIYHLFFRKPSVHSLSAYNESKHDISCWFFGSFSVSVYGKALKTINGRKVVTLLAYLLYHHNKPVHREILMSTFWPNSCPSSARNSLNSGIYSIRKAFQPLLGDQDLLIYQNECYVINPNLQVVNDVEQFTKFWNKGRELDLTRGLENAVDAYSKAVEWYAGDFLEEIPYDNWCESIRDNLRESYLSALNRLSLFFFEKGVYPLTINICKRILDIDPFLEEIHQRLMICYDRTGARNKAIRQYYQCQAILKEELKIEPGDQTRAYLEAIMRSQKKKGASF